MEEGGLDSDQFGGTKLPAVHAYNAAENRDQADDQHELVKTERDREGHVWVGACPAYKKVV